MSVPTATPEQVTDAFLRLAKHHPLIKSGLDFYSVGDLCPHFFPDGLTTLVETKGFSMTPLQDEDGHLGYLIERGIGDAHLEFIVLRVVDDDYLIRPFPDGF